MSSVLGRSAVRRSALTCAVRALAVLLPLAAAPALAADAPSIRPTVGPMTLIGSFGFTKDVEKRRKSVSGIACPTSSRCLIAFDEGAEARFVTLSERGYEADPRPVTLGPGGEIDAEAAASDAAHLYVTGSYAVKRKDCATNPASRTVLRLDHDGRTLQAGDLTPAIEAIPALRKSLGLCLDTAQGLDIEGLAASGGRLWFGLRGPETGKVAKAFSVDADALFASPQGDLRPELREIEVGRRRAIRDMAAVEGGFLVLAGPDDDADDRKMSFRILFWNGKTSRLLADLDLDHVEPRKPHEGCRDRKRPRPEALAVAATTKNHYRVAVLSDGLCDGGPMWFEVPR